MLTQPPDEKQQQIRAGFLATSLGMECIKMIGAFLSESNTLTDPAHHGIAVKELIVGSIWLSLLELGEDQFHDWLHSFFLAALEFSDRLHEDPPSNTMAAAYATCTSIDDAIDLVTGRTCKALSTGGSTYSSSTLCKLIREAEMTRRGILICALNQPIEELNELVKP